MNRCPFSLNRNFTAREKVDYFKFFTILDLASCQFTKLNYKNVQLYIIDNFLTVTDCCYLIENIRLTARPSVVSTDDGADTISSVRTSHTTYLNFINNPYLFDLNRKICGSVGLPMNLGESLQAQLYEPGDYYKPHFDFFKSNNFGSKFHLQLGGQRTWTFMVYLNHVELGGETHFPKLPLKLKPIQGRAVIWNNLNKYGKPNLYTLHEVLPPVSGNKYILTKWFRSRPVVPESPSLLPRYESNNWSVFD